MCPPMSPEEGDLSVSSRAEKRTAALPECTSGAHMTVILGSYDDRNMSIIFPARRLAFAAAFLLVSALLVLVALGIHSPNQRPLVEASVAGPASSPRLAAPTNSPLLAVESPRPAPAGTVADAGDSSDSDADDPYEIRGFVQQPDQTGLVRTVAGPRTGADDDYDAGLVDEDGNPTAVEIGSAEDEAMQLQALRDEWAADATQSKKTGSALQSNRAKASTNDTSRNCSAHGPAVSWNALDDSTRATLSKPTFDVISFDADPRRRFVRVKDVRYEEGSKLPSGESLLSIGPASLTIDFSGCLVALSYAEASR